MLNSTRWLLVLLAFPLVMVTPVWATDAEPPGIPSLEEQIEDAPPQTPAPTLEDIEGLADPGQDLFFEALRYCETPEEFAQCPSHCWCVVSNSIVYCSC